MAGIHSSLRKLAGGSSTSLSLLVDTFITHCMVMAEKDVWLLTSKKSWLMDMTLFINSMDASGMVVLAWELPMTGIIK